MRAQRECVGGIEIMANTTKLTPMQKKELNDRLIAAAETEDVESVKKLIDDGADVDVKDNSRCTALHWAVIKGNIEIAKILIENRADVDVKDKHGRSAQDIAIQNNNHRIIELIENAKKTVKVAYYKGIDILNIDMDELVRRADESAKRICRRD